ncbi:hypothetical protein [Virgibacillus sp. L01]|uniref:hypothetical protein n=1 Tax=Virgibacillus sp. L01 TaxID=3457429 RepID=UPI003FD0169B
MIKIRKTSNLLGIIAGIASIILWFVLKPTEYEPMINTFFSLALPAVVAIIASLISYNFLMLIAFLWSLPISLYMVLTPSYFALFGITCTCYLISFILLLLDRRRNKQGQ